MEPSIWTYATFHLVAGRFIDKLGPRVMYSFAVLWWSPFTALTALATGFVSLFGLRLGLGVGESAAYPTKAKVVSRWFPVRERAFATSIYDSGARAGTALSAPLVAFIIAGVGWRCRVDQEVGWAARLFSDRLIRIGACLEFSQRR